MNKIKVIITALCIAGLSLASFVHAAELSDAEQSKIRKQLYKMDDLSELTNEQIAQYKEIVHQHIIKLENKIEKGNRLLSLDVVKGGIFLGIVTILSNQVLRHIKTRSLKNMEFDSDITAIRAFILTCGDIYGARLTYCPEEKYTRSSSCKWRIMLSIPCFKIAYDYLRKAYNAKDRAKSRLLRDKGVLYQLERVDQNS